MIHKCDAIALLDNGLRETEAPNVYSAMDRQARSIVESLFGDREHMTRTEAKVVIMILKLTLSAMMAAHTTAVAAGDTDEGEPDATE